MRLTIISHILGRILWKLWSGDPILPHNSLDLEVYEGKIPMRLVILVLPVSFSEMQAEQRFHSSSAGYRQGKPNTREMEMLILLANKPIMQAPPGENQP